MPRGKRTIHKAKKPPTKGRPSVYHPEEHPLLARRMTAEGKTLADIAEAIGINRSTITEWRETHPIFSAAIKLGREDATDRVERALIERATGYTYPSEKIVVVSGGQGMGSSVERVKITEHCPPDTAAAKFYLSNRRPEDWKEKSEVEITGDLASRLSLARERVKAKK
jgi:transcriptional regulator with XRE-family HTH domain